MSKIVAFGTVLGIAFGGYTALADGYNADSTNNPSQEVAGLLHKVGQKGLVEVRETEGRREISFDFTPTTDIDSFFCRANLSKVTYIDIGREGPSEEDTLVTRMSFIIRDYDKRFDGKPASTDHKDGGLKGRISIQTLNMPGYANWYDKVHYLEVSGEKITAEREKYSVVMNHIAKQLRKHQRKGRR